MQIVIYTLLNYLNCCIKQDTNYDIAKCLLVNIRKISKLSLEDCAILCNVSPSTLNRFCRSVGFNNYSTIKRLLKNHELPFNYESFIESYGNRIEYVEKLNQGLLQIESIPNDTFMQIAKLMEKAQCIYLLGYGDFHYQAGYFQNVMLYHGKLLEIINQNERLDPPVKVCEDDLIIITSLSGGYVKNMLPKLKKMNCHKVLITQNCEKQDLKFNQIVELGSNDDTNVNKYLIMRVYERMISSYYFYKSGQNMTSIKKK